MIRAIKHIKTLPTIPLVMAVVVLLAACGGSRNGNGGLTLDSVVKKLNAQYSEVPTDDNKIESMSLVLDGKRMTFTVRYNQEGTPVMASQFEEKLRPTNAIPSLPVEFFTIWRNNSQHEVDVPGRDVLTLLIENDVDIVIQEKDKKGTILAEAKLDTEKMKERIRNWEERERENEIILAKVEMGTFTDLRDGHAYKTGTVVGESWIAEDIVYGGENLYTWDDAKKICPDGWRLPSAEELGGLRFLKFRWKYIDYNQKPAFWSSSTKKGLFGEEAVAVQPKDDGTVEIGIPVNLANSPDKKHPVRCIKKP